jgi:hypothetical protein
MDQYALKMEARAASAATPVASPKAHDARVILDNAVRTARERPPPSVDPFRLGWREAAVQIPMTPEGILNPQEGDVVSDGYAHNNLLLPLADAMRRHLKKRNLLVTCGVVLVLDDGKNCAPDIAVIEGDVDESTLKRAINLRAVGGRLIFALEVVSTSEKEIENKDIKTNVKRYANQEVDEYLTIYPLFERKVEDLVGRQLVKGGYKKIVPDKQKRVHSKKLNLHFVIDKVSKELVALDALTDQRLLISDEEEAGRLAEKAGRSEEKAGRLEAETGRSKEKAGRLEAETGRSEAERLLAEEAAARRKAEQEKLKAEQEKLKEAEARRKAEKLNREMMAELQRLRTDEEDSGSQTSPDPL